MTNTTPALTVWLVTDDKPGHKNQLRGLLASLQKHTLVQPVWLSINDLSVSWKDWWKGRFPQTEFSHPDIAIAAGHRTHRHLLTMHKHFDCFTTVLMKPSLPLGFFDAAIIPAHDKPRVKNNVLVTRGVINTVQPSGVDHAIPDQGLMLIGGPSKHYHWDNAAIVEQVWQICSEQPHMRWLLTDSRRTPTEFAELLKGQFPSNLTFTRHQDTTPDWLPNALRQSSQTWVSPDSVSMVYEALTAQRPTGIFDLSAPKKNRIVKGIDALVSENRLTTFADRKATHTTKTEPLWEAERAALWLLKQYQNWQETKS